MVNWPRAMPHSNILRANFHRDATQRTENGMLKSESSLHGARVGGIVGWKERAALRQAGAGLERIVAGALRRAPQSDAPLLAWPLVCGSAVAQRTWALRFTNSVLSVEVPDSGWKREMQNLAPRYVAAMNRYAVQKVERIEFVIQRETPEK